MSKAKDRIFISIGVSNPRGGLEELPGVITAVERMAVWAKAQGYETLVLHDADLPEITIDLLRDKITSAIKEVTDHTELKRLVIFFAGHGAALAIGDQYWILTNWQTRPTEAIKVSSLQRMLEYYGPKQVSIIGDACQEFSSKFIDLLGSPVLDMPSEAPHTYELDQFFAVDVGKQAFMIKANGDTKDFCLFTEVLLDALEGDTQETYFEEIGLDKVVTSQSLARYLDNNVAREAGKHGIRMNPRPKPGFYTDRTYLTIAVPLGNVILAAEQRYRSVDKAKLVLPSSPRSALDAKVDVLDKAREAMHKAFVNEVGSATVRDHFETGCGICVSGADVTKVEASFGEVSFVAEQSNCYRIDLQTGNVDSVGWSDALVTLANERIVSVCAVNGFVAALHIINEGTVSLFHRPLGAFEYEGQQAIDLLARAHAGLLSHQEIIETAAMLREGKHRIITLGCIAAQLYDAIRDVDSLRSMAAFYAMNHQPVPLDIVLYGGGTISDYEGRLYADIPAVAARKPRTPEEGKYSFNYHSTPGFQKYPIAGRVPWMRHAWGAIETASCHESGLNWRRQALAVMEYLAPGTFTIIQPQGREVLGSLVGITVNQNEPEPFLNMSSY